MTDLLGQFVRNGRLLLFLCTAPALLLLRRKGLRGTALRFALATLLGWPLWLFAVDRAWDLRVQSLPSDPTTQQMQDATADGASLVCALTCGWFPSALYALPFLGLRTLLDRRQPRAQHPNR